jgi:hypothetical protein
MGVNKHQEVIMKIYKIIPTASLALLMILPPAIAKDFDWTRDFNIMALTDPSGCKAKLAARFHIGDVHVKAVLNNLDNPSDTYIILRLGEMSGRPIAQVVEKYNLKRDKGWGALAKS